MQLLKNSIANINRIYVGEQLTIPTSNDSSATTENKQQKIQHLQLKQQRKNIHTLHLLKQLKQLLLPQLLQQRQLQALQRMDRTKESGGSYTATNGRYIGRQLDASYLNGDYSAANQERVAEQYVTSRYGSWDAAKHSGQQTAGTKPIKENDETEKLVYSSSRFCVKITRLLPTAQQYK